ncbi:hypothetical protein GCM10009576_086050 [Streptomyces rhizosphaericus]|uniref:Transposase n=2 Tax=Streptomyces rhizosphaericus TaxID=114699 RepID=A0ABN1RI63_9ACTN
MAEKVKLTGAKNGAGTTPDEMALSIIGGMVAGADSIDDLDVLRHGGLPRLLGGMRAPSTPGTFLRAFTWGHVRQLEAAARAFTCNLADTGPGGRLPERPLFRSRPALSSPRRPMPLRRGRGRAGMAGSDETPASA